MLAKYLSAKPLITLKFRFLYVGTFRLFRLKECLVWVRKRSYFGLKYLFSSPQTAGEVRNCANIFLKNHPVGSHIQMLEPRLEQRSLALQPYHLQHYHRPGLCKYWNIFQRICGLQKCYLCGRHHNVDTNKPFSQTTLWNERWLNSI